MNPSLFSATPSSPSYVYVKFTSFLNKVINRSLVDGRNFGNVLNSPTSGHFARSRSTSSNNGNSGSAVDSFASPTSKPSSRASFTYWNSSSSNDGYSQPSQSYNIPLLGIKTDQFKSD